MHVIGYDPEITVDSAWSLPATVKKAHSLSEVLKHSNFISLHVPLVDATRGMIDAGGIAQMKPGAVLLNFSRGGVVDEPAVLGGPGRLGSCRSTSATSPDPQLAAQRGVILLPHLGASTREAEENCAVMVADQVRDYLLDGTIRNSVNFPDVISPQGVAIPSCDRQCERAEHGRRDLSRDGDGRAEHRDDDQQVAWGSGVHAGRRGQCGARFGDQGDWRHRRRTHGSLPAAASCVLSLSKARVFELHASLAALVSPHKATNIAQNR